MTRSIMEDLLPLYSEGLLRDDTARWLEAQIRDNPEYQHLLEQIREPLPAPAPAPTAEYETMMRKIRRKLSVMQLIFVALSFFMAMSTSMMGGSFGFVLWYAVLGGVTFLFYRDVRLVLLVALVPIFVWVFADAMQAWVQGSVEGIGLFGFLLTALGGSLLGAVLHGLFACIGMAIVWLFGRKKVLTLALSVLLVMGVFAIYDAFNGNPVNKWLAEQKLKSYLAEKYPEQELRIGDGVYNFKFSTYEFQVTAIGQVGEDGRAATYRFALNSWFPRVVSDGLYQDSLDEELMERLGAEAAAELSALLQPEVPALRDVGVYVAVQEGELPEDTPWSKDLPEADGMQIDIVLDAAGLDEDSVRETARRIQAILDGAGYPYGGVLINANDFSEVKGKELGPLKFAAAFRRGEELADIPVRVFNED